MPSLPPRAPSTRGRSRVHAVLGTVCGLGLLLAPVAGSIVVVKVTAPAAHPATVVASAAAPVPSEGESPSTTVRTSPAAAPPPAEVAPGRRPQRGPGLP